MKGRFLICVFSIFLATVESLDVVFDLPAKLRHGTRHNVILTTFDGVLGERLSVTVSIRTGAVIYSQEHSVLTGGVVDTHHFPLMVEPSENQCRGSTVVDVLCSCTVEVAVSSSRRSWSSTRTIPITRKMAHIFIETDRTVYRAGETVYLRFVPVDEGLKPLRSSMAMSITAPNPTPGGEGFLSWKKNKAASNGIFSRSFKLPATAPLGEWHVNAHFQSNQIDQTQFGATFFVEDYSLPTFEIEAIPSRMFILLHDTRFVMRIAARYIHGEPLEGTAHVRFVVPIGGDNSGETKTTHIITRSRFSREFTLTEAVANLTKGVSIRELVRTQSHLTVQVSVTDKAQGNTRTKNVRVAFTDAPLVLGFGYTPGFYKPGLTFSLQVTAKYIDGRAAENVRINLEVTAQRNDGVTIRVHQENQLTCTGDGSLLTHFDGPLNSGTMVVRAVTEYSENGHTYPITAERFLSSQTSLYDEHMQIVLPKSDLAVDASAAVEVYLTPLPRERTIVYTVYGKDMVLAEGTRVVPANAKQAVISLQVTRQMSPLSHITAYYVSAATSGSYITADSAVLRVTEICRGTTPQLQVNFPRDALPYPGQALEIEISGHPSAYVGLMGVDVAAKSLRDDYLGDNVSSSSNSMLNSFNVLRSFSPGCKSLAMPSPEYAFTAVGRTLASSVSNALTDTSSSTCDDVGAKRRKKRDLFVNSAYMVQKASKYYGSTYKCCEIGAWDISSVVNIPDDNYCQERNNTLAGTLDGECRKAFMACCAEAHCLRQNPRNVESCASTVQARRVNVGFGIDRVGSQNPSVVDRTERRVRSKFDETWFTADFRFGPVGRAILNNSSSPRIPPLPHSITSWSVGMFTISPENGMCVLDPFVFPVEHSLFMEVTIPTYPVVRGTPIYVEATIFSYFQTRVDATVDMEETEGLCGSNIRGNSAEIVSMNPASSTGIASTEFVRFTLIPTKIGHFKVKVVLKSRLNGNAQPSFVDKVVKVLHVIPEGERQRKVEWKLVDARSTRRRRQRPSQLRTSKTLKLSFPPNAIPGTEKATLHLHGVSSAATKSPKSSDDSTDSTIAPYLYTLQSISVKLEYLRRNGLLRGRDDQITALTEEAQRAYDGVLSFIHDFNADKPTTAEGRQPLYGFSFAPTSNSKPDLWLTSVTLRLLTESAQLINPDPKILTGTFNYIRSHQVNQFRIGGNRYAIYYANKPVTPLASSRSRRSSLCRGLKNRLLKKRCQKKRSITKRNLQFPMLTDNLDRKIYRTSVITSELDAVRKAYAEWRRGTRRAVLPNNEIDREQRIQQLDDATIRNSLASAYPYIGSKIRRVFQTTASPITLTSAALALFRAAGARARILPKIETAILTFRRADMQDSDETWFINSNRYASRGSLNAKQQLQVKAATVEATAYQLHRAVLRGQPAEKYANWLLKQRQADGHWVSLRDSLAAMHALGAYVAQNSITSPIRVEITNAMSTTPLVVNPEVVERQGETVSRVALPVTNNVVSLTTVGRGQAWLEIETEYNVASTNTRSPSRVARSITSGQRDLADCPYQLSVSSKIANPAKERNVAAISSFLRSADTRISKSKYLINVNVTYNDAAASEYDGTKSYVIDVGIGSDLSPVADDLVKLSNSVEKLVDRYTLTDRALLLYVTGGRSIFLGMTAPIDRNFPDFPVTVYPEAFPEQRCTTFFSLRESPIKLLCSNDEGSSRTSSDVCACAAGNACPKFINKASSSTTSGLDRKRITCVASTIYDYRIRVVTDPVDLDNFATFTANVRTVYKSSGIDEVLGNRNQTFWIKNDCEEVDKIRRNREYHVTGETVVQGNDGIYKHLLDDHSRVEWWPKGNNCQRYTGTTKKICTALNFYDHLMTQPC